MARKWFQPPPRPQATGLARLAEAVHILQEMLGHKDSRSGVDFKVSGDFLQAGDSASDQTLVAVYTEELGVTVLNAVAEVLNAARAVEPLAEKCADGNLVNRALSESFCESDSNLSLEAQQAFNALMGAPER